jgi:hypothetical protein
MPKGHSLNCWFLLVMKELGSTLVSFWLWKSLAQHRFFISMQFRIPVHMSAWSITSIMEEWKLKFLPKVVEILQMQRLELIGPCGADPRMTVYRIKR